MLHLSHIKNQSKIFSRPDKDDVIRCNNIMSDFVRKRKYKALANTICFSYGQVNSYSYYYQTVPISFNIYDIESHDRTFHDLEKLTAYIRMICIVDFGLAFFDGEYSSGRRYEKIPKFILDMQTSHINLDQSLSRLDAAMLNINFCKYCHNTGHVLDFFYIGPEHILFAMIMRGGRLIIRWKTLKAILNLYSERTAKSLIKKVLDRYLQYLKSAVNQDLVYITQKICEPGGIVANHQHLRNVDKALIDEHIAGIFKNSLKDMNDHGEYFQTTFRNMQSTFHRQLEMAKMEGYFSGLKLTTIFGALGWEFSEARSKSKSSVCWEKKVQIVPNIFVYDGLHYLIPEEKRKWKITKLFLYSDGRLNCDGRHPNVSGGDVCLGDMGRVDFSQDKEKLIDNIQRAERLLEIINYDSPYDASALTALRKVSKPIDSFNKNNKNSKSNKDVGFRSLNTKKTRKKKSIIDEYVPKPHRQEILPSHGVALVSETVQSDTERLTTEIGEDTYNVQEMLIALDCIEKFSHRSRFSYHEKLKNLYKFPDRCLIYEFPTSARLYIIVTNTYYGDLVFLYKKNKWSQLLTVTTECAYTAIQFSKLISGNLEVSYFKDIPELRTYAI